MSPWGGYCVGALRNETSPGARNGIEQRFDAGHDPARQIPEHGPLGGDELNIVLAGGNYGWRLFSYG